MAHPPLKGSGPSRRVAKRPSLQLIGRSSLDRHTGHHVSIDKQLKLAVLINIEHIGIPAGLSRTTPATVFDRQSVIGSSDDRQLIQVIFLAKPRTDVHVQILLEPGDIGFVL